MLFCKSRNGNTVSEVFPIYDEHTGWLSLVEKCVPRPFSSDILKGTRNHFLWPLRRNYDSHLEFLKKKLLGALLIIYYGIYPNTFRFKVVKKQMFVKLIKCLFKSIDLY